MCGRYTLTCPDRDALIQGLPFAEFSETRIELRARYNIAPGQRSPVVYVGVGGPTLADAQWGFERPTGGIVINARSETVARTAMFREAFREGRCLVPADGFFEWRREGRLNQPYLFRKARGDLFVTVRIDLPRDLGPEHLDHLRRIHESGAPSVSGGARANGSST